MTFLCLFERFLKTLFVVGDCKTIVLKITKYRLEGECLRLPFIVKDNKIKIV